VAEQIGPVDPQRIHTVREALIDELAARLQADWAWAYKRIRSRPATGPTPSRAASALANLSLSMLVRHAVATADTVGPAAPTSASRTRRT
jgi:aminopeptidase N